MKSFKKIGFITLISLSIISGMLLFVPAKSSADLVEVKTDLSFTPQVGIPSSEFVEQTPVQVGAPAVNKDGVQVMRSDLIARYLKAIYNWGLGIAGIIAVVMLMAGGLMWITSGGSGDMVSRAQKMIVGSITGLALLVGAYLLLTIINPNLVNLPTIDTELIGKITPGCCEENGVGAMTTSNKCKGVFSPDKSLNSSGQCDSTICCVDITYELTKKCFKTLSSNCPPSLIKSGEHMPNYYKISTDKCADTPECQGKDAMINCADVDYGGQCAGTNADCWCYNGLAYMFKFGKANEPCGNEQFSKCDENKEQDGKTCNRDLSGGRNCDSNLGLVCCSFKEDGTRINN